MSAYEGKVKMGVLPVTAFSNGHTFFVQRLHERLNVQPYAVHATFQYGEPPLPPRAPKRPSAVEGGGATTEREETRRDVKGPSQHLCLS